MRRIAALLALLAPLAAHAETYTHALTWSVPAGNNTIGVSHADKFLVLGTLGEGVAYDTIYLPNGGTFNGDGIGLAISFLSSDTRWAAVTSFSTGGEKTIFTMRSFGSVLAGQWIPYRTTSFNTDCMVNGAIASDRQGYCYLFAGCDRIEVRKLDPWDGVAFKLPLVTFGSFAAPRFIAVAPDGHVYVTANPAAGDAALSKFAPDGSLVATWPLTNPGPVATDFYGNVFVIDHAGATVFKFSPEGIVLASWQTGARTAIGVSDYDSVYLLSDRGRVEKWVIEHSTPAVAATWGQVKARWR
jgi:hypothetical protein